MAKSTTFDNQFLSLIFNAIPIANVCDNAASSPLTSLFVALHTADPSITAGSGTVGQQNASEIAIAAYAGYARVAVPRSTVGWTVTGASVSPTAGSPITFPICTGGTGATASFWSVGTALTGSNNILYSGPINPIIVCASGVTPILTTASTITES
jgi:hypothetical protein